ncbi:response regulator [Roseateles chitinivorans]|uniref:response regulator n=1 Tax=Roseateles chitinivorans TaxID=2917965 RepID=UPI003D66DC86
MNEADGLRVLLVDDVVDALEPLQMLLALRGCEVRSASCADAALAIEKVWRPDVVITDIGLPGMDGRQLASQLRALDPHVVIIALSGTPPPSDWNSEQTAMFDHYLVKPLNFTQLEAMLGLS